MTGDLRIYQFLVENVRDGVYFVNHDRMITGWNRGATEITGYAPAEVLGRRCQDGILNHVDELGRLLCTSGCPLAATMSDGQPREMRAWMSRADGSRLPVRMLATPTRDSDGTITGAMEVFTDESPTLDTAARAEELRQTALTDQLTGVGSAVYLAARLSSRCDDWDRHSWPFGVVLINIDQLESIRGEHGNGVGDRATALVARTVSQTVTGTTTLARFGDDQLAVLQPCSDAVELGKVAERLRRMIAVSRLMLDERRIRLTVSVGAAMITVGDGPDSVLHRANLRLDDALRAGGNTTAIDDETNNGTTNTTAQARDDEAA